MIKRIIKKSNYWVDLRGDNNNSSIDSRHFGVVKFDQIHGVVHQVIKNKFNGVISMI